MAKKNKPKAELVIFPGTKLSPQVLLHRLLDNVENIESIAVVLLKKDGEMFATWSNQSTSDLAAKAVVLQGNAYESFHIEDGVEEDDY